MVLYHQPVALCQLQQSSYLKILAILEKQLQNHNVETEKCKSLWCVSKPWKCQKVINRVQKCTDALKLKKKK